MKIHLTCSRMRFDDLKPGDVFEVWDKIFIKITPADTTNSIQLCNGSRYYVDSHQEVVHRHDVYLADEPRKEVT